MSIGSGDATCALFEGEAVLLPEQGIFHGVEGWGELEGGGTSLSTIILFPLLPTVSTHLMHLWTSRATCFFLWDFYLRNRGLGHFYVVNVR